MSEYHFFLHSVSLSVPEKHRVTHCRYRARCTQKQLGAEKASMAASSAAVKRRIHPKLTIEGYLDFIQSGKRIDLSVDHLNQIIHMHGFRKFQRTPKSILVEVVSKLELMDPSRSTIEDDGVTSDAFLSIEEVIKDLNDLKWQECCITSLQTLNAAVSHPQHETLGTGGSSAGTVVSASSEKHPKKQRRRKLKQLAELVPSPKVNVGSPDTLPRTPVLGNWSPRKKRTPTPNRGSGATTPVPSGEGSAVVLGGCCA